MFLPDILRTFGLEKGQVRELAPGEVYEILDRDGTRSGLFFGERAQVNGVGDDESRM